ncbi:MAG: histidine phosphatase family protein [Acidimicrobiales bacterium]
MPSRRLRPTIAILVRHGLTATTGTVLPGRAKGLHLAGQGARQAAVVAQRIASLRHSPVAVYASPLERAVETARPIADMLGLELDVEQGLLECDFGDWTGESLAKLRCRREWNSVQYRPAGFRSPGGESIREMQERAVGTIDALVERHRGESFVAVSHADPIKAVVASAAGTPLDLFQRFAIAPCSVSAIAYGEDGPSVLCTSSTASLDQAGLA